MMLIAALGAATTCVGALAATSVRSTRRLEQRLAQAHHAATHDGLTGIANRCELTACGRRALGALAHHVVVMVDLDRFKPINDTFGHHVGDEVLCSIARRLSKELGPFGLVARLGGDEFAAVLTVPADKDPYRWAYRLLTQAAATVCAPLVVAGRSHRIGASVGAVTVPSGASQEFSEVLQAADKVMYTAKSTGIGTLVTAFTRLGCVLERPAVRRRDTACLMAVTS